MNRLSLILLMLPTLVVAQGTKADYDRAGGLRERYRGTILNERLSPNWVGGSSKFWYLKQEGGGAKSFVLVDPLTGKKGPAFDHKRMADAVTKLSGTATDANKLPFTRFDFSSDLKKARFKVGEKAYEVDLTTYEAKDYSGELSADVRPGATPPQGQGPRRGRTMDSPDGKWRMAYKDDNLVLVSIESKVEKAVTTDGTKANSYNGTAWWSPDSKHVAVFQSEPGDTHPLNIVVTTPKDQFQPKLTTQDYLKPGDKLPKSRLRILDVDSGVVTPVDDALYTNPFDLDNQRWLNNDQFAFRYNQRGHQVLRFVGVDAKSGIAKTLINEEAKTFIDWNYKSYFNVLPDKKHAIWMSERSGWCHLYMYDLANGESTPITKGDWVVRRVVKVDDDRHQIWFMASGQTAGEDPYHLHFCRVNFDGSGFVRLTAGDGTHTVEMSPDNKVIFDSYSRADMPPRFEVRGADDGKKLVEVEQADISGLLKAGFKVPLRFSAKARDGETDIYGLVYLPTNFDPAKKYPVVEDIYAGPQGSFVPKAFHTSAGGMTLAELGFIVVRIDGLGTNDRSKAFHDICWKNLVDAGLPDRILWMKAAAQKWTQMDLSRVGIYGTSAGGQNALDAVLTHGEFYKVAMADCGCYDNRMDKMWWNEQWMGYPIGPHYEAQSGRTLAHNLTGKLLMMVGEEDNNVDPASTYQVIDALEKADKDFEFVVIPNNGHGAVGNPYARRRFYDFFVRNLLGVEPRH
jgi:dipeptidyl-peptidase-4